MTKNLKIGLVTGVAMFLYSLASQNFWPDLNIYVTALLGALVAGGSYKIAEVLFGE